MPNELCWLISIVSRRTRSPTVEILIHAKWVGAYRRIQPDWVLVPLRWSRRRSSRLIARPVDHAPPGRPSGQVGSSAEGSTSLDCLFCEFESRTHEFGVPSRASFVRRRRRRWRLRLSRRGRPRPVFDPVKIRPGPSWRGGAAWWHACSVCTNTLPSHCDPKCSQPAEIAKGHFP